MIERRGVRRWAAVGAVAAMTAGLMAGAAATAMADPRAEYEWDCDNVGIGPLQLNGGGSGHCVPRSGNPPAVGEVYGTSWFYPRNGGGSIGCSAGVILILTNNSDLDTVVTQPTTFPGCHA